MSARRPVPSVLVAGALLLGGCGSEDSAADAVADTVTATATDADIPHDEVVGAINRGAEGGERPEDLPDDVPVPAGLSNVLSMGSDGRTQSFSGHVVGTTPKEVRDDLATQLEAAGWDVDLRDDSSGTSEDVAVAALEAEEGDRRYEATFVQIGELVNGQLRFTGE